MDVSTRAALVQRISPYLSDGAVVPQTWEELPLTTRLVIETNDAEAAAVFRGSMGAELEAQVLAGKWSADVPTPRDLRAEKEAEIQSILGALPVKGQEQLEAEHQARLARIEEARLNSARMAGIG